MVFGAILAGGKGTRMGIDKPTVPYVRKQTYYNSYN